jgi:Ca2+-binding EF-hand superfamily protein
MVENGTNRVSWFPDNTAASVRVGAMKPKRAKGGGYGTFVSHCNHMVLHEGTHAIGSLNSKARRDEAERIEQENARLAARLAKTKPVISPRGIYDDVGVVPRNTIFVPHTIYPPRRRGPQAAPFAAGSRGGASSAGGGLDGGSTLSSPMSPTRPEGDAPSSASASASVSASAPLSSTYYAGSAGSAGVSGGRRLVLHTDRLRRGGPDDPDEPGPYAGVVRLGDGLLDPAGVAAALAASSPPLASGQPQKPQQPHYAKDTAVRWSNMPDEALGRLGAATAGAAAKADDAAENAADEVRAAEPLPPLSNTMPSASRVRASGPLPTLGARVAGEALPIDVQAASLDDTCAGGDRVATSSGGAHPPQPARLGPAHAAGARDIVLFSERFGFVTPEGVKFSAQLSVLRRGTCGLSIEVCDSRTAPRVERLDLTLAQAAAALGVLPDVLAPPGAADADVLLAAYAGTTIGAERRDNGQSSPAANASVASSSIASPHVRAGGVSGVVPFGVRREAWRHLALLVQPVGASLLSDGGGPDPAADDEAADAPEEDLMEAIELTHADIEELIHHIDAQGDGDGEINVRELEWAFRRAKRNAAGDLKAARALVARLEALIAAEGVGLAKWFDSIDVSQGGKGDGRVTLLELKAGLRRQTAPREMAKHRFSAYELAAMMRFLDPNGDGDLDLRELRDAIRRTRLTDTEKKKERHLAHMMLMLDGAMRQRQLRIKDLFFKLDADRSGTINLAELTPELERLTKVQAEPKKSMIGGDGPTVPNRRRTETTPASRKAAAAAGRKNGAGASPGVSASASAAPGQPQRLAQRNTIAMVPSSSAASAAAAPRRAAGGSFRSPTKASSTPMMAVGDGGGTVLNNPDAAVTAAVSAPPPVASASSPPKARSAGSFRSPTKASSAPSEPPVPLASASPPQARIGGSSRSPTTSSEASPPKGRAGGGSLRSTSSSPRAGGGSFRGKPGGKPAVAPPPPTKPTTTKAANIADFTNRFAHDALDQAFVDTLFDGFGSPFLS